MLVSLWFEDVKPLTIAHCGKNEQRNIYLHGSYRRPGKLRLNPADFWKNTSGAVDNAGLRLANTDVNVEAGSVSRIPDDVWPKQRPYADG